MGDDLKQGSKVKKKKKKSSLKVLSSLKASERFNEHHVKVWLAYSLDGKWGLRALGTSQIILIKQADGESGLCSIRLSTHPAINCTIVLFRLRGKQSLCSCHRSRNVMLRALKQEE